MRRISSPHSVRPSGTARPGYLLVAVLVTATIVTTIGLAAVSVARSQLRSADGGGDEETARLLARSGVELGIAQINSDPDWQANIVHGAEHPAGGVSADGGTMTWQLENEPGGNGKLLTGIGRSGEAEYRLQVKVGTGGVNSVGAPLLVGGTLWVGNYTTSEDLTVNDGDIRCNSTITNWGTLSGNLEAQGFNNSGTHNGTATVPGAIHQLPDPQQVFDYYVAEGTLLPNGSLDDGEGGLRIVSRLLSPSSNPWGTPNPHGIYVVNAGGKSLSLQRLRVVGTLVVINGGTGWNETKIQKEVNFEPAYPNYPSLMIQGDVDIKINDLDLSETDAARNFNPPGTPWQTNTDSDLSDTYPSRMSGVVYCSGNVTLDGGNIGDSFLLQGVLICGGNLVLEKECQASIDLDPVPAGNPPPGFGTSASGEITPGTWHRIPNP